MSTAKTLALDPAWLPDALDAGRGVIRFARIDSGNIRREAFLDARKNGSVSDRAEARIGDVAGFLAAPKPASYIFHSAFCGSTLLARALDAPGRCLALKEPGILLDLVNARRAHTAYQSGALYEQHAEVILRLLDRPWADNEQVLVKPTNLVLPLAPQIARRGSPIVILYGSLHEFLVSILKKGEEGRAFVRKLFNIFAMDKGGGIASINPRQAMAMTDLQIAAIIWRHQIEEFDRLIASGVAAASLDYASFIADPEAILRAAAHALRLDLPAEAYTEAATGAVFQTDAKDAGRTFTARDRSEANADFETKFAAELTLIKSWAETLRLQRDFSLPLQKKLAPAL